MQWLYYANIKLINIRQKKIWEVACQKLSFCIRIQLKFIEMRIQTFTLD